jgi:diguanylate cyclase (GGDEF)-like protein/PAS domain S-box-containing protein
MEHPPVKHVPRVLSAVAVALGATVLLGWVTDSSTLTRVSPGLASMKPNAALCFLLLGAGLWLSAVPQPSRWARRVAVALAVAPSAVGAVTLLEYLAHVSLPVDQLVPGLDLRGDATRMAPATAFSMLLLGAGVVAFLTGRARMARATAMVAFSTGYLAVLGYVYGVSSLYQIRGYTSMALHTALGVMILAVGLLSCQPERGLAALLRDRGGAGRLTRPLVPSLLIGPAVIGRLRLDGQTEGLYDTRFGVTLLTLSTVVIAGVMVWRSALGVQISDAARDSAQAQLELVNAGLERAVAERTAELEAVLTAVTKQAIIATDTQGVVTAFNGGAEHMLGLRSTDVVGNLHLGDLFDPDGLRNAATESDVELDLAAFVADASRPGAEREVWTHVRQDGSSLRVDLSLSSVLGPEEQHAGFLAVVTDISAQTAATEQLAASEEQLRLLVDGSRDHAILMLDPDGIILTWNQGAQRLRGYQAHEAIGRHFSLFYTAEDVASGHPEQELRLAQADGRYEEEGWRVRRDGTTFWANVILTAVHGDDGQLRGFSNVTHDLSERRASEERLRASEQRARRIVETSHEAFVSIDAMGAIAEWNTAAEDTFGWPRAEVLGRPLVDVLVPASHRAAHRAGLARLAAGGEARVLGVPLALPAAHRDGHQLTMEFTIWSVRQDDTLTFHAFMRDVTDRNAIEASMRMSEERFRRAFHDAPTGAALTDLTGRYLQVNDALCKITGYSAEALLSMRYLDLTHPEEHAKDQGAVGGLISGELQSHEREKRYVNAAGDVVWVSVHVVPVHDQDGAVVALLAHTQDISQRRLYEKQLIELANHDPLTGLANRTRFHQELDSHLARCQRHGADGAVLMLDLDHFKRVNDALGHNAGDQLLVGMASVLRSRLRAADVIARLGGDEFAILLPHAGRAEAENVAAAIVAAVRAEVSVLNGSRPRRITTSIGVVLITDTSVDANELLINADMAMYDAKDAGRDRLCFYADEQHAVPRSKARITWVERIENALTDGGFELWAQPILDLHTNQITSHELLLRLGDDQGATIAPGTFLYVAERVGLITEIDRWVTTQAIDLLARLQPDQPRIRLEVNLSGLSVGDDGLRDHIAATIASSNVDPAGLVFEITETAAVERIHAAREFAEHLKALGCRFALDDFGAGFGSFYYLKHLPFDYVKIDGEFIAKCTSSSTDRLIIESVVNIARGLGKETIGEFVGDEATLRFLQSRHVDYAQGYHVGKPVPVLQAFPELPLCPPGRAVPGPAQPEHDQGRNVAARQPPDTGPAGG